MTLIAFTGELGIGKTLSLTYNAYKSHLARRTIYSNYHLYFPYTSVKTLENLENMRNGYVALDELWTWVDSRYSGNKRNKIITMILAKSRKRDLDIGYTAQDFGSIDKRIRLVTDFRCYPILNEKTGICHIYIYTKSGKLQKIKRFNAKAVYPLYDTNEEVIQLD